MKRTADDYRAAAKKLDCDEPVSTADLIALLEHAASILDHLADLMELIDTKEPS